MTTKQRLIQTVRRLVISAHMDRLPVRVRSGIAAGARWTLLPWSSYWRGTHEPELQRSLLDLNVQPGWSCWDLGAHFGLYAVGLARLVGPTGEVAAFEPNPVSYARLCHHRRMNRLDWLKTFPCAVSEKNGSAELYTYGNLDSTTTHLPYENETPGDHTRPVKVEIVSLDEMVNAGQIRRPNLIKVDVEGHGHRALLGARNSIAASRPLLVVALHSQPEYDGVRSVLEPLGYTSSVLGTHSGSTNATIGHDLLFRPSGSPQS